MKTTHKPRGLSVVLVASCLALAAVLPLQAQAGRLSGPLIQPGFPADAQLAAYAKTGLASLTTFQLSNGIPVVLRQNPASPIRNLTLVIRGGSASATADKAGYELLALKTMARGSAKFAYKDIQAAVSDTTSAMGPAASIDSSTYSLNCLSKYFDKLFPIWADTLVAPTFNQNDFNQALSEAKLALQGREKDPWQKTAMATNQQFFAGHPYSVPPEGTKDSLAAATLDAVKAWYGSSFSADRIFIVAVGDFDPAALKKSLDAALSTIPDRKLGLPPRPPRFTGEGESRLTKVEFPSSKGVAYLRGDFAAPSSDQPDYMAASLAAKMLSDLLNDVVRNQHGAVYTPGAYVRNSLANYGSITMYKTNVPGKVKAYIDEAMRDFMAGRVIDVASGSEVEAKAAAPRASIESVLEVYKAQFTNSYFQQLATNAEVAGLIAQSVIITGDCRTWLLDAQRIAAVDAASVKAAAAKYLFNAKWTWVALSARETLVPVVDADFQGFGVK
jgi:zinc protease